MDKLYEQSETGCCPRFDSKPWEDKEIKFQDKLFLKDHVRSFLHIPLNFDKIMVKNMEKIQAANALSPEPLLLSDEKSMWGSDVYIAVSKEVPGAQMEKISGTFLSKVFEGPYKNMGKWAKEMQEFVKSKGKDLKKMYFFYTTCPKCAKYYGKNYTVILAHV
ncbi:MAG: hydrolase [Candidatus Methanoperedens sp.]